MQKHDQSYHPAREGQVTDGKRVRQRTFSGGGYVYRARRSAAAMRNMPWHPQRDGECTEPEYDECAGSAVDSTGAS